MAGGAVALAAAVRWVIDPWLGDRFPYAIFLIAVIVVAFFGRFRLSLFATAAAALVGNYLFVAPRYALAIPDGRGAVTLILFLTAGIISALLADYVGRTRERLRVTAEDRAAHDAYQVADLHEKFIAENKATWKKVRVFDSDVSGAK